jgi:hypothetical protein
MLRRHGLGFTKLLRKGLSDSRAVGVLLRSSTSFGEDAA